MRVQGQAGRVAGRLTTEVTGQPARRVAEATALAARQVSSFEAVGQVRQAASAPPPPAPAKTKSFWDSVGDFFGGAAKAVGEVVNRVGDAVRSVVTGVGSAVTGVVRNVGEAAGTFFGGLGKLFSGDVGGALRSFGSGLLKVVQTPVDALLMVGGRAVSAVQTVLGLEPPGRKLTAAEIATLRKVYGDSIDYDRVRLKTGDVGVFGNTGRAFVHGDTVYVPEKSLAADGSIPPHTLVHEFGHVWQHQHGGTDYMSEALAGQYLGEGYDWRKGLDAGKSFSQLNPEQQAELIADAFQAGYFDDPSRGFKVGGTDYTAQLEAAMREVRAGRGAP